MVGRVKKKVVGTVVVFWLVWTEALYLTTRDSDAAVPGRGTDRPGRRVYRAHWRTGATTDGLDLGGQL